LRGGAPRAQVRSHARTSTLFPNASGGSDTATALLHELFSRQAKSVPGGNSIRGRVLALNEARSAREKNVLSRAPIKKRNAKRARHGWEPPQFAMLAAVIGRVAARSGILTRDGLAVA
jgi:hypothetical protein